MAFQPVVQTADVVITYLANSVNMQNVVNAHLSTPYALADLQALADAVDVVVAAEWLPLQTLDCSYVRTTVRGLEFENDQEATADASAGPGEDAVEGLPNQVTFSVKKQSGLTGRSARGRLYWIGIPVNQLQTDENKLTIAASDDIEAAVDALRAAITATDWQAVIVSRFSEGLERDPAIVFNWTGTEAVNINIDTQRRRLLP